jgi:hypothetical protein
MKENEDKSKFLNSTKFDQKKYDHNRSKYSEHSNGSKNAK